MQVSALGISVVLLIALGAVLMYASSANRHAARVNSGEETYALAEMALNNAISVLGSHYPESAIYPGDPSWLPLRRGHV